VGEQKIREVRHRDGRPEIDSARILGAVRMVCTQIPTRKTDMRFRTMPNKQRAVSAIDTFRESILPLLLCCCQYRRMRV